MLIDLDSPHHQLMIVLHCQSECCTCTDLYVMCTCQHLFVCVCFMYRTSEEMKMTECAAYDTHKPHYTDEYEHVTTTWLDNLLNKQCVFRHSSMTILIAELDYGCNYRHSICTFMCIIYSFFSKHAPWLVELEVHSWSATASAFPDCPQAQHDYS